MLTSHHILAILLSQMSLSCYPYSCTSYTSQALFLQVFKLPIPLTYIFSSSSRQLNLSCTLKFRNKSERSVNRDGANLEKLSNYEQTFNITIVWEAVMLIIPTKPSSPIKLSLCAHILPECLTPFQKVYLQPQTMINVYLCVFHLFLTYLSFEQAVPQEALK